VAADSTSPFSNGESNQNRRRKSVFFCEEEEKEVDELSHLPHVAGVHLPPEEEGEGGMRALRETKKRLPRGGKEERRNS
jgi:hypothetical protein